jgi:serine/threonine-protein kinase
MIDLTGKTLANRYDLLALIGTGGMGSVYRARDRELDELVALKVIRAELAALPAMAERFRHEVKLARRVTHTNVARTFELGSADGVMFCTMELIEGESLTTRLAQRKRLPITEAVAIASAMCDALEAAHVAGVIHRDIKPDNVLIAQDGRVVLADFGVAAVSAAEGELSGTPAYMAPEQARGEAPTPAADVYAVGAVLYEMLTGQRAFPGDIMTILEAKQTLDRVAIGPSDAPPELGTVIAKTTERDVGARFATAAALRQALGPWGRPAAAASEPARHVHDAADVRTVYVVGVRGSAHPQTYLANALHEQVLGRLRRVPLIRVVARFGEVGETLDPDDVVVRVGVDDMLTIAIERHGEPALGLRVPAHVEQLGAGAELALRALESTLGAHDVGATNAGMVEDLLLRARHLILENVRDTPKALAMLEEALALTPDEPRLIANLAIAHVRLAFFMGEGNQKSLQRAIELASRAIVEAPHLADSHIAMGHVELNRGNAPRAAVQFRQAIACAPHLSEPHEQLGRLLLEAGYLDVAMARLDETLRMAGGPRLVRWDIARAHALEGNWGVAERIANEMQAEGRDRGIARVRYRWWQRDMTALADFRRAFDATATRALVPDLIISMLGVFLDGTYAEVMPKLRAAFDGETANPRRRAFAGQLIVEGAAFAHDLDTAFEVLDATYDAGLFDFHWLDKCQLLAELRTDPRYLSIHARVKARAEAILDALYGDQAGVATQDTIAFTL